MAKLKTYAKKISVSEKAPTSLYGPSTKRFRHMSFFIRGGVDVDGDALEQSAQVISESYDVLNSDPEQSGYSDSFTDPRMGLFDHVAALGAEDAQKAVDNMPQSAQNGTTESVDNS